MKKTKEDIEKLINEADDKESVKNMLKDKIIKYKSYEKNTAFFL